MPVFREFPERAVIEVQIDHRALRYKNELEACIPGNPLDEEPTLRRCGDDHLGQPGTTSDVPAETRWTPLLALDAGCTQRHPDSGSAGALAAAA